MRRLQLIFLFFFTLTFFSFASEKVSSQRYIDPLTAKNLVKEKGAVFVDTMSYLECMDHRIPGSLCISLEEFEKRSPQLLKDKTQHIIFYCESDECLRAGETHNVAKTMGYENLYILDGGLPAWKRAGFEIESIIRIRRQPVESIKFNKLEEFKKQKKNLFILDVRSEHLFKKGHLEGAVNIPLYVLHRRIKEIPKDRSVLVVDETGKRSFLVCCYLINNGIRDVTRLFGGMKEIERGKKQKR
ncbi:MAG: rhodanese-like domain-containing protein [Syntrophorhabdaceae bacterium]|nr:rhodanese-like domain-containing protein [Syntrophorhabdaceae bacterium]